MTQLPSTLEETISEFLNSFALTLGTYACGRDNYSPVSTCEDCWNVYRDWLCSVMIPRCGEKTSSSPSSSSYQPALLTRTPETPRFPNASTPTFTYDELLPCLESCHEVDRICPVFLGFTCPLSYGGKTGLGTASQSYGVDLARAVDGNGRYIIRGDNDDGKRKKKGGGGDGRNRLPVGPGLGARAGDEYGEVYCNIREGFVG